MQQTITGLYLSHINYGETSVILKLFTLQHGTTSFIVKGIKRKKGGQAILQPFHYLELTSNFKAEKELNFGNQVRLSKPSYSLTSDIRKSTVSLFLTEVLNKTLKETAPDEELYHIIDSLITLYDESEFLPIFHHYFIIQLIISLGIAPNFGRNKSIDLLKISEGIFEYNPQPNIDYFSLETSQAFKRIIGTKFDELENIRLTKEVKQKLLINLINYIETQTQIKKGSIQSYKILETIFHH
jgi:DNA repair protein RecO (recombination protein O)